MNYKGTKVKDFIKAFGIYKEGVTLIPVSIVYHKQDKSFDIEAKKEHYRKLGYAIIEG